MPSTFRLRFASIRAPYLQKRIEAVRPAVEKLGGNLSAAILHLAIIGQQRQRTVGSQHECRNTSKARYRGNL
jgi:hypothetical protein